MTPPPKFNQPPHPQRGMALIEALVASAVLGIGLVGAVQLSLKALALTRENRQSSLAQLLAQEAMACLHANSPTAICPSEEEIWVQGVRYTRQASSGPTEPQQGPALRVRVSWQSTGPRQSFHQGSPSSSPAGPLGSSATPTAPMATPTAPMATQTMHLEWHSSATRLPGWLGVSSP